MNTIAVLYMLLGMNDEYMCRRLGNNYAERFYENDRIQARVYYDNAVAYLKEEGIKEPISISVSDGGHIIFHNKYLNDVVDSKYTDRNSFSTWTNAKGQSFDIVESCIKTEQIRKLSEDNKNSYLLGLYIKHERSDLSENPHESCMNFANSFDQVESSVVLLMESGYKKVTFENTCENCEPASFKVCFDSTYDPIDLVKNANSLKSAAIKNLKSNSSWGLKK